MYSGLIGAASPRSPTILHRRSPTPVPKMPQPRASRRTPGRPSHPRGSISSRGADQRLYLRAWRAGKVLITGPLKFGDSGGRITAFRGTPDALTLTFGDFQPASQPGYSARPLAFNKEDDPPHLRQAYVRLTIDQQPAEFWMPCSSPDQLESLRLAIPEKLLKKTVIGKGRRVELTFAPESFHIGYTVSLHKAWRKLDPGTRQASFYGSEIDLCRTSTRFRPNRRLSTQAAGRPNTTTSW